MMIESLETDIWIFIRPWGSYVAWTLIQSSQLNNSYLSTTNRRLVVSKWNNPWILNATKAFGNS